MRINSEHEQVTLFVYGTLLIPEIWMQLIERVPHMSSAKVFGFRRYRVMGAHYPGLWPDDRGDWIWGALVAVSDKERQKIDEYEGDEYTLELLWVYAQGEKQKAYTYIRPPVSDEEWNLPYLAPVQQK